jgi:hypothetical protein
VNSSLAERMVERRAETRAFLEKVASRLPLAEVLRQDGVRLVRQGRTYRGPCPIHSGRNPNFVVLPGGQKYYCHKCGASGDIIDYLQQRPRGAIASFPDALAWLSEATGVELPRNDGQSSMHAETRLDIARHPIALDFAVRFYHAARDSQREQYEQACREIGVSLALADDCGAGFVPEGNCLSANIVRYCSTDAWPAFHRLGLVDQRFTATDTSDSMLFDRVPAGHLIWPLIDRGRLAGLAVLDRNGDRTYCTEPGRTVDPRFAILATPDETPGWSKRDADPSADRESETVVVWRDARSFWDHAFEVPGPHLVPAWRWGTSQDAPRVRTQLRGRDAVGVVTNNDDVAWWARGPLLEWVDGICDVRPGASQDDVVLHPLEVAVACLPGFNASAAVAEIATPLRRLVMAGWLAQASTQGASTPRTVEAAA